MATTQNGFRRAQESTSRSFVRDGLEGRTIYLPRNFLDRFDQRPGQLVDVLTDALSAYLATVEGGVL